MHNNRLDIIPMQPRTRRWHENIWTIDAKDGRNGGKQDHWRSPDNISGGGEHDENEHGTLKIRFIIFLLQITMIEFD